MSQGLLKHLHVRGGHYVINQPTEERAGTQKHQGRVSEQLECAVSFSVQSLAPLKSRLRGTEWQILRKDTGIPRSTDVRVGCLGAGT